MKLYLDIDGVLLTVKQTRPAENATQFIDFVVDNFECYWLTTHCKGDNKNALAYLGKYFLPQTLDKLRLIKPTSWDTLKTEAIDFSNRFLWIEDSPFLSEKRILESSNCLDNLIVVDLRRENELSAVVKVLEAKMVDIRAIK